MNVKQAELFKVLGVDSRIRIIEFLKKQGPKSVNEISAAIGITPSAVSQHLKVLKYAGLVSNERKGYWIPYQVDYASLEKCGELLSNVCSCGCEMTVLTKSARFDETRDNIDLLKEYQKELKKELLRVQSRIKEIKEK
jgi:DNA-binding transcriptional ArsR family regulator